MLHMLLRVCARVPLRLMLVLRLRLMGLLPRRGLLVLLASLAVPLRVLLDEVHLASAFRARAHGRTTRAIYHCG